MCDVGCSMNGCLLNHIIYADDLMLISSSTAGLCRLLHKCEEFGISHDMKYNAKKSAVMIFRSVTIKRCSFPGIKLNGTILPVINTHKYLGNYISDDLSDDDDDINKKQKQNRELYTYNKMLYCKNVVCAV